jgi:hypothetical protein
MKIEYAIDMITQYIIALFLSLFIFFVIYSSPVGKESLLLPDGSNPDHPWNGGDIMTYVNPAKFFLETGTFLRDGKPDLHRTVGYPFFLAIMMSFFGQDWLKSVYIVQIFIFSFLFPAVTSIAKDLSPSIERKEIWLIYVTLIMSGMCIAYIGQLMTDQFFAAILTMGISFGFAAIRKESLSMMILHVFFVGYAAQVRPILGLFFFGRYLLHASCSK